MKAEVALTGLYFINKFGLYVKYMYKRHYRTLISIKLKIKLMKGQNYNQVSFSRR